jgi:hypothetical protein
MKMAGSLIPLLQIELALNSQIQASFESQGLS